MAVQGPSAQAAVPAELRIGKRVTVRKTVGESDVYLFAGISGDFAPLHVDEEFMRSTRYGRRIAHGALMLAYMSAASTKMRPTSPEPSSRMGTIASGFRPPCSSATPSR